MTAFDRPERESRIEEDEDTAIQHAISQGGTIYSEAEQMKLAGRLIKRVRELTKTIDEHGQATTALTERVRKLNVWLLMATIAIAVMTLVQAGAAWKSLTLSAGSAWVLWSTLPTTSEPGGFIYRIRKAFETKAQCDAAKTALESEQLDQFARVQRSAGPSPPSRWDHRCLPDTVDPRGPKGRG